MAAVLECSRVSAGYDGKAVLNNVGFALQPGEVLALLGPNGGGKSTLLRTLAGLTPKLGGDVKILADDLAALSAQEVAQRIGFVPQEEAWQFDFSVRELVTMGRLPLSNGFFDTDEDRQAAEAAMQEAGCFELCERRVTELSGGERQRVLIARALAQETPIIFLDEPTSHLDPRHQVSTSSLVRGLAKAGKSLLVAIHDLTVVATLADRGMLVYGSVATEPRDIKKLLEDEELEKAYGTDFERVVTPEGRLVVVPRLGA